MGHTILISIIDYLLRCYYAAIHFHFMRANYEYRDYIFFGKFRLVVTSLAKRTPFPSLCHMPINIYASNYMWHLILITDQICLSGTCPSLWYIALWDSHTYIYFLNAIYIYTYIYECIYVKCHLSFSIFISTIRQH